MPTTYKYAKWSGGATSGTASTPGTAWDVVYALADADRVHGGVTLLVLDGAPYTMTAANRLRMNCGSGSPGSPVCVWAADADGNPHHLMGTYGVPVSAGDNRATWGSTHASTPIMWTIGSVNGQGPGHPIQHWDIRGFCLDGVSARPYGAFCNAGAANNVYNNNHGYLSDNLFINYFHTGISWFNNADQAGAVGATGSARCRAERNVCLANSSSSNGTGINARNGPSARGGMVCLHNFIDGGADLDFQSGIALGDASASDVRGNTIRRCVNGVFAGFSDMKGTIVENNHIDACSNALAIYDSGLVVRENKIVDCTSVLSYDAEHDPEVLRRLWRNNTILRCTYDVSDVNDAYTGVFERTSRALGVGGAGRAGSRLRNRIG